MAAVLLAWGANSYGQLGVGHKEDVLIPQSLKDVSCKCEDIKSITGGGGHSAVITGAGELFVCGQNKEGQLGLNHTEDVLRFTLCTALSGFHVKEVACGWDFTIILVGTGVVLSCGSNAFGQLGIPQISGPCLTPQKIESLKEKVVDIAAGLRHALAATESGLVLQWGTGMASRAKRANQGKTLPLFLSAKEPCEVTGLEDVKVKRVTASSYHSVSLTDEGHLYVWGSNKHGQLVSEEIFLVEPKKIETQFFSHEKIGAVWSGWTHLVAQTETGKVFTWGRADYGQLGRPTVVPDRQEASTASEQHLELLCNVPISVPCLNGASQIACGSEHNLAVVGAKFDCCHRDGTKSFFMGKLEEIQFAFDHEVNVLEREKITRISTAEVSQLKWMLYNYFDKSDVPYFEEPCFRGKEHLQKQIPEQNTRFCSVETALQGKRIAVRQEEIVGDSCFSWGWNEHGMCGDGTEANVQVPKPVKALSFAKQILIGCGAGHSMALCQTSH